MEFFVKQPLVAFGQGALSAGIMQGLANTVGMIKQKHADKQIAAIEAGRYLLTTEAQEFDDLSPAAQKIVKENFSDHPQDLQKFIAQKSPTGSLSKEAQMAIDAAVDVSMGKKTQINEDVLGTKENTIRFSAAVDDVFSGKTAYTTTIVIGKTPRLLIKYGAKNRNITITPDTMYKIAYPKEYLVFLKGEDASKREQGHNLGLSALKHLPEQIANPIAILKSKSERDSFIVLTEWEDENRNPIIIPLHLNKTGALELENRVTSAYGKRNIDVLIGNDSTNVLYTKNNEDIHQLLSDRHQLPAAMAEDVFKDIIPQSNPTVNTESSPKSDIEAIADDLPIRHIDGSVRSYKEYAAEQEAKKQDTPPPADTEAPTANPDVEAAVNAPGIKRAEVIDLSAENALLDRLKGLRGAKKYKAVKDYILGALGDTIIFNDGIKAKVDKSDALHLAHKAGHVKVSYFSKIREIIDSAMLFLTDDNVTHNKFDAFRYYKAVVRLGEDEYPIYLNVGHAKNGDGYHLYDITKNVGEVEKQTSVFERVNDLRSKNDLPTLKSVPQPETDVKDDVLSDATSFESDNGMIKNVFKPKDAEVNEIMDDEDILPDNVLTDAEAQSFSGEKYYVGHSYSHAFDRYAKNNLSLREALMQKAELPV